jgi:hypothetical protein
MGQSIDHSGLPLADVDKSGQSIDHSRLPLVGFNRVAKLLTLFYSSVEALLVSSWRRKMGQSIDHSGLPLADADKSGQSIDHSRLSLVRLDGVAKLLTLFYTLEETKVAKVLTIVSWPKYWPLWTVIGWDGQKWSKYWPLSSAIGRSGQDCWLNFGSMLRTFTFEWMPFSWSNNWPSFSHRDQS